MKSILATKCHEHLKIGILITVTVLFFYIHPMPQLRHHSKRKHLPRKRFWLPTRIPPLNGGT